MGVLEQFGQSMVAGEINAIGILDDFPSFDAISQAGGIAHGALREILVSIFRGRLRLAELGRCGRRQGDHEAETGKQSNKHISPFHYPRHRPLIQS